MDGHNENQPPHYENNVPEWTGIARQLITSIGSLRQDLAVPKEIAGEKVPKIDESFKEYVKLLSPHASDAILFDWNKIITEKVNFPDFATTVTKSSQPRYSFFLPKSFEIARTESLPTGQVPSEGLVITFQQLEELQKDGFTHEGEKEREAFQIRPDVARSIDGFSRHEPEAILKSLEINIDPEILNEEETIALRHRLEEQMDTLQNEVSAYKKDIGKRVKDRVKQLTSLLLDNAGFKTLSSYKIYDENVSKDEFPPAEDKRFARLYFYRDALFAYAPMKKGLFGKPKPDIQNTTDLEDDGYLFYRYGDLIALGSIQARFSDWSKAGSADKATYDAIYDKG